MQTTAPTSARADGNPRTGDGDGATGAAPTWGGASRPLAGPDLLDRLRVTGRVRAAADPEFTAELLSYLEEGLRGLATVGAPGDADRLLVTKERVTRSLACPVHRVPEGAAPSKFSVPLACGALVGVLFRQLVTCGALGDPMTDALDGLALDERQAPLVAWIGDLSSVDRSELQSELDRQASGLVQRWPTFDGTWLPRTDEIARVPLMDGAVELFGRVDLAVGHPARSEASVALVDTASGARRPEHRGDRRFDALVETLRSGTAPFAVATYYTRTGELDVEAVDGDLLADGARRCRAAMGVLVGVDAQVAAEAPCPSCSPLLRRTPMAVVPTGADTPVMPLVDLSGELAA